MLVLSRRKSEQIVIGDRIKITVLATKGNIVHLGIDAPDEVPVHRAEIHRQIEVEQEAECVLAELAF